MKPNLLLILIGIILLLLGSLAVASKLAMRYKADAAMERSEKEGVSKMLGKTVAEVSFYKNKNGQLVTRNEALTFETKTVKQLMEEGHLQYLKELQGLKKDMRNLEYAYRITAQVMDSAMVLLHDSTRLYVTPSGDSVYFKAQSFTYMDAWATVEAQQVSPTQGMIKYQVKVPITGAMYWDRKWFLGKRHYWAEATSENPHVVIPELINIKTGRKRR